MRMTVKLLGIGGGVLLLMSGVAALIAGGADTVIVGAWITVVAAVIAIVGAVLAGARPGRAALLMAVAVVVAGLVAPGVIPALADSAVVFIAYLTAGALLVIGATLAFVERKEAPTGKLSALSH